MNVAFSVWNERISPVFDVSRRLVVVEIEAGRIVSRREAAFQHHDFMRKAAELAGMDVQALVCGAISRPLAEVLAGYGIRISPFIAGGVEEVIQACVAGTLSDPSLAMPGCLGRTRNMGHGCCMGAGRRKEDGKAGKGRCRNRSSKQGQGR